MKYKVKENHKTEYPNPIILTEGEKVIVGQTSEETVGETEYDDNWTNWIFCTKLDHSNEGWVPKQIITIEDDFGIITEDYSAKELDVDEGTIVEGLRELNGWLLSKIENTNEIGWIPLDKLEKQNPEKAINPQNQKRFYIVRPFDLATRHLTYKITINDQDFLFKGIGTKPIDVAQSEFYTINVSIPDEEKTSLPITVTARELPKNSRIIIKSNFTNLRIVVAVLAGILGLFLMFFIDIVAEDTVFSLIPSWIIPIAGVVAPWLYGRFFGVKKENYFTIIIDNDSPPIWENFNEK